MALALSSNYVIFNKLLLFEHYLCTVRLYEFFKHVAVDYFVYLLYKTSEYLFEEFFPRNTWERIPGIEAGGSI
jgi:hypothetical protein